MTEVEEGVPRTQKVENGIIEFSVSSVSGQMYFLKNLLFTAEF